MAETLRLRIVTAALAGIAGLIGGTASRYIVPESVHAQVQAPAKVVSANRFLLVDENNHVRGVFAIDKNGIPNITLSSGGKIVWRAIPDELVKPANLN